MDARDRAHLTHFGRRASLWERSRERAMRDWFGEDAGAVISAHRTPPRHISGAVDAVLKDLGMSRNLLFEDVLQNWVKVVGVDVAGRSVPSEIRGTQLVVEVADSSWMYLLQTVHRASIVAKLKAFSRNRLHSVRFVPKGRIRR